MVKNTDWEGIVTHLDHIAAKGKKMVWCVVGAGNGGIAMAGHLGIMGFLFKCIIAQTSISMRFAGMEA